MEASTKEEVTRERFLGKLLIREDDHQWTVNRVVEAAAAAAAAPEEELPYAPESGQAALEEIANGNGEWNWALLGPDPETMPLVGGGADSVQGMMEALSAHAGEVLYGWVRLAFGDEARRQVRKVFVHWVGPNVPPAERFRHSLSKQKILDAVGDWAVGLDIHAPEELNLEAVFTTLREKEGPAAAGVPAFTAEDFGQARQVGPPPVPKHVPGDPSSGIQSVEQAVDAVRQGPLNWLLLGPAADWKTHWASHKKTSCH